MHALDRLLAAAAQVCGSIMAEINLHYSTYVVLMRARNGDGGAGYIEIGCLSVTLLCHWGRRGKGFSSIWEFSASSCR